MDIKQFSILRNEKDIKIGNRLQVFKLEWFRARNWFKWAIDMWVLMRVFIDVLILLGTKYI